MVGEGAGELSTSAPFPNLPLPIGLTGGPGGTGGSSRGRGFAAGGIGLDRGEFDMVE